MIVLDILIVSLGYNSDGTNVLGDVRFEISEKAGETRSLTVSCRCPLSNRIPADALLVGDAIRQLRRMPEIRSGERRLEFAPGLKPLDTAKAA
ncbi:MAG: hypothetical protein AAGA47_05110 [Pseudomonadota bacterium]